MVSDFIETSPDYFELIIIEVIIIQIVLFIQTTNLEIVMELHPIDIHMILLATVYSLVHSLYIFPSNIEPFPQLFRFLLRNIFMEFRCTLVLQYVLVVQIVLLIIHKKQITIHTNQCFFLSEVLVVLQTLVFRII